MALFADKVIILFLLTAKDELFMASRLFGGLGWVGLVGVVAVLLPCGFGAIV